MIERFLPSFNIGDEVKLKIGGPKMTVVAIEEDQAICEWSDGAIVRRENIKFADLRKAKRIFVRVVRMPW